MDSESATQRQVDAAARLLQREGARVHMAGICGVGMAGLAAHLKESGFRVNGCDLSPNSFARTLGQMGIRVLAGHDPGHAAGADWIIRTAAIPEDHPEMQAARRAGKTVLRRGAVMAALSAQTSSICVCGTHGKTTTASMIAHILARAGKNPSFCIGGQAPTLGALSARGRGEDFVMEADESDGSLAGYTPAIAVVTNIDFDHAEHFKDMASVRLCFARMARRVRGRIIYCRDDPGARRLLDKIRKGISYGFEPGADLRLRNYRATARGLECVLSMRGRRLGKIRLPFPGRHNALNAAAACLAALERSVPFKTVRAALASFHPVARRFERLPIGRNALLVSDYAHHPAEISALVSALAPLGKKRWIAVFQPHRYSRTRALGKLFPSAFHGVNEVVLCPVYAASEQALPGGTVWDLYRHFRERGAPRAVCATSLRQAWEYVKASIRPGDGALAVGAGNIGAIARWAVEERGARQPAVAFKKALKMLRLRGSVVRFNEPMDRKTTLRVGGTADIFIEAACEADLAKIARLAARLGIPVKPLGAGSNVLASDLGVRGAVVRLKGGCWNKIRRTAGGEIEVGAAVGLQRFVDWAARAGLAGAEFLAGIPGTVGGAARMNAGAWGRDMAGIVTRARTMGPDGSVAVLDRRRLRFAYRDCSGLHGRIVLSAVFKLKPGWRKEIIAEMNRIRKRRKWMNAFRSAGSVFKNPAGAPAGRLLEELGFKGYAVGGARFTWQHANVIATGPGARASDVLALIETARGAAARRGAALEDEIVRLE